MIFLVLDLTLYYLETASKSATFTYWMYLLLDGLDNFYQVLLRCSYQRTTSQHAPLKKF